MSNPVIELLDLEAEADALPSPCISVCRMDPVSGLCDGCLRTIDEIVEWSGADQARKLAIWIELKRRYTALAPAAGK